MALAVVTCGGIMARLWRNCGVIMSGVKKSCPKLHRLLFCMLNTVRPNLKRLKVSVACTLLCICITYWYSLDQKSSDLMLECPPGLIGGNCDVYLAEKFHYLPGDFLKSFEDPCRMTSFK